MTSPMCVEQLCRCRGGGCGGSQQPRPGTGGQAAAAGRDAALRDACHRFPESAVIWTDCCHQPGCGPHCLQHSEHFYASQHSPPHPSPRSPRQLCCEILKALLCFFFPYKLNDWNFYFDVYFKSSPSKILLLRESEKKLEGIS